MGTGVRIWPHSELRQSRHSCPTCHLTTPGGPRRIHQGTEFGGWRRCVRVAVLRLLTTRGFGRGNCGRGASRLKSACRGRVDRPRFCGHRAGRRSARPRHGILDAGGGVSCALADGGRHRDFRGRCRRRARRVLPRKDAAQGVGRRQSANPSMGSHHPDVCHDRNLAGGVRRLRPLRPPAPELTPRPRCGASSTPASCRCSSSRSWR